MSTDTDVSTLNSLIKTTLDSVKGFEEAAENVDATRFSSQFREFAQERRQVVTSLQAEVRRLGGNPEDDSSFLAAAHRTFMNLKDAVTGRDDKAVVNEVERGEDYIKEKYQAALRDTDVSPQVRQVIEQAYESVRRGHDRASQLKHSLQGQGSY
ncbi:ferritin-like domain-containing protein [Rhizorhabdus argentea]|uniref:ferritin-like domain-containing protein n=1 Tax=Rhizorhabdus argentea TaxID=1387174 RepID=UPI0030ED56E2